MVIWLEYLCKRRVSKLILAMINDANMSKTQYTEVCDSYQKMVRKSLGNTVALAKNSLKWRWEFQKCNTAKERLRYGRFESCCEDVARLQRLFLDQSVISPKDSSPKTENLPSRTKKI